MTETSWATRPVRALLVVMALLVALTALPLAGTSETRAREDAAEETLIPGEDVIVVLEPGEDPEAAARAMGVDVTHVYRNVFTGFAGRVLPPSEQPVSAMRARQRARDISPDGEVHIEAQKVPLGVRRAGTPVNPDDQHLDVLSPVDADIAIIDTGITPLSGDALELNVRGGHSCVGNPNDWEDDNGHGTHVAGIAAAADNDDGVVGVAPEARLWAVKVLDSGGSGSFSDVVCGLDWVLAHGDIEVVNLSLSGEAKKGNCSSPALHAAVCALVDAGITVVVAAGNQNVNANKRVPASYDEVITVSALTDSDGKPGSLGPRPCFGKRDDVFANFSNYGGSVDIVAPGGCIESYTGSGTGSLATFSGTSQAAPHVAGAVANHIADTGDSPAQVRNWLLTQASRPQSVDGLTGDPDSKQARKKAKKAKIKKLKKKMKKAKGKNKKKRLKKKLKKERRKKVVQGPLEPVLWLEDALP